MWSSVFGSRQTRSVERRSAVHSWGWPVGGLRLQRGSAPDFSDEQQKRLRYNGLIASSVIL